MLNKCGRLNPEIIAEQLETLTNLSLINDYSFIVPSVNLFLSNIGSIAISNEGKSYTTPVNLNGVSFNLYNTTVNDFLMIQERSNGYKDKVFSKYNCIKTLSVMIGMTRYLKWNIFI